MAWRRAENDKTAKNLEARVEDWKGYHIANFGELLLYDIFLVTQSDVDREYHVFLFEKVILFCKEVPPNVKNGTSQGAAHRSRGTTPLALEGRIFLCDVTEAISVTANVPAKTTEGRTIYVMCFSILSMIVQVPVSHSVHLCECGGTMIRRSSHYGSARGKLR